MSDEMLNSGVSVTRRYIAGGIMLATAAASLALKPRGYIHADVSEDAKVTLPDRAGIWVATNGDVLLPDGGPGGELYDQVVGRSYQCSSHPAMMVMVMVGYGKKQTGPRRLHMPRGCYLGAGFELNNLRHYTFLVGNSIYVSGAGFDARRNGSVEKVVYWSRIGDKFPINDDEKLQVYYKYTLAGQVADGVIVRFSYNFSDEDDGEQALISFTSSFISALNQNTKKILLGNSLGAMS